MSPSGEAGLGFSHSLEAVKEAVPLAEYAGELTNLSEGKVRRGRCPVHGGSNPTSFIIYPDDRHYYCHSCGAWGDVVDLCRAVEEHAELWTAMLSLAYQYGVELPERRPEWYERQRRQRPVRDSLGRVRANVIRRRVFRFCVLPQIDATVPDPTEHDEEVRLAWEDLRGIADAALLGLVSGESDGDPDSA